MVESPIPIAIAIGGAFQSGNWDDANAAVRGYAAAGRVVNRVGHHDCSLYLSLLEVGYVMRWLEKNIKKIKNIE